MIRFAGFCLLVLSLAASTHAKPPRLIVRGDDMGFSHSGNQALIKCFTDGIETSIEVIVPSPWFPEAVELLAEHPDVDVGIHLALTAEWDNVKWRPVTHAPSLCDDDGYFFPMIYPNRNYPDRSLKDHDWQLAEIAKEVRAQIELAKRKIPRVSHVSCHMGFNSMDPRVDALVRQLAAEYGIDVDLKEHDVARAQLVGPRETAEQKVVAFMKMLDRLEEDKTYMFVEHPGFDTPELRAIHHVGYENVAEDRQGVTTMWTDPRVVRHVKELGIELIDYRDLK